MPALEIKKLAKHFDGVTAVNDLSLEIERGLIVGIIGPNGSGKTTLVNLLSGVFAFNQGAVVINAAGEFKKIKPWEIAFYGLTRTFQEVRLFNQISALDNILLALTERDAFKSLFEKHSQYHLNQAETILKRVNLWDKKNELAGDLSYGQRKLLEIARAAAMQAQIYLFDEPFAGLFSEMIKIIKEIIKDLKQKGDTIVLIEHNVDLIRELCDKIFVLDSGELLAQGKPEQVLKEKKVIEAYLGE